MTRSSSRTGSRGATLRVVDVLGRELPDLAEIVGAFGDTGQARTVELLLSPDRLAPDATPVAHPFEDVLQVRGLDPRPAVAERFAFSPFTRT